MYHGIINVYKEKGYTSFDVVAKMRGICGQKKIGHTGTLDPQAEGVLPVCLGNATKVCGMLTDSDKVYRAVMLLGVETDTQDMTGTVLSRQEITDIAEEDVRRAVGSFVGEIRQIPPMYSALKVNGKKLCDLARAGVTVERRARPVTIYEITIDAIRLPRVEMTVRCSKGTYIRTLCHDIGRALGCGAAMEQLTRLQAAGYRIGDARRLDELEELKRQGCLSLAVEPVDHVFCQYPPVTVREEAGRLLQNGNALRREQLCETGADCLTQPVRVYDAAGRFCAVYRYDGEKEVFRPVKMFLEE